MKKIVILIGSLLLIGGMMLVFLNEKEERTLFYTNPVGGMTRIGDPFVLKTNGTYYMYATSEPNFGYKVWQSSNLVDWEEKGMAYVHFDQPQKWATGDFWAPEVVEHNGKFYMTYSARNLDGHLQISIALSPEPLGPFTDISTQIIKQEGSYIDGHIFIDDDGKPFLYYVKDCSENIINGKHVSQIFVQEMNDELTELLGEPQFLTEPDANWEKPYDEYQWNEGPFVLKHEGIYYLMYSSNYFASHDYSVGYATASNPFGPFEKALENPILTKDLSQGISGPGHNSVTIGPDDETLYIVYHTHTIPNAPSGNRQMNIDRLYIEDGKLKVDGPTSTEQKIKVK